ncbi:MAG: class E sortase, partial [Candidatus Saccharimonadales bacterium]
IPSLLLDQRINEGNDASTLAKGLWRRPQTSTPASGGNTVIVGHRLTYSNPRGTLYHLDKVQTGDSIGITWAGKNYAYTVREVKVVTAAAIEIEEPTTKPQLTIYTCTPLWLPRDRLVVIATPEKDQ